MNTSLKDLNNHFTNIDEHYKVMIDGVEALTVDEDGYIKFDGIEKGYEGFMYDAYLALNNITFKGINFIHKIITTSSISLDNAEDYRTNSKNIKVLSKQHSGVLKVVTGKKYNINTLFKSTLPVTAGYAVTFSENVKILKTLTYFTDAKYDVIEHIEKSLFNMLDDKVNNITKNMLDDKIIANIKDKIEVIRKDISKIATGEGLDTKPFLKVIPKLDEYPDLIQDTLVLGKGLTVEDLKDFSNTITNLERDSKLIADALGNDKVKKEELIKLADYFKTIAYYITSISIIYYSYSQLVDMMVEANNIIIHSK